MTTFLLLFYFQEKSTFIFILRDNILSFVLFYTTEFCLQFYFNVFFLYCRFCCYFILNHKYLSHTVFLTSWFFLKNKILFSTFKDFLLEFYFHWQNIVFNFIMNDKILFSVSVAKFCLVFFSFIVNEKFYFLCQHFLFSFITNSKILASFLFWTTTFYL